MDVDDQEEYEIFWDEEERKNLLCSECWNILYPPKQLDCCGVRICRKCAERNLNGTLRCPDQDCRKNNPKIQPDRGYENELLAKKIRCPLCPKEKIYLFKDLLFHLKEVHRTQCPSCQESFHFPRAYSYHQKELCQYRSISCPLSKIGCEAKFPFKDFEKHCTSTEHQMFLTNFCENILYRSQNKSSKNQRTSLTEENKNQLMITLREIESILNQLNQLRNQSIKFKSEKETYEKRIVQCRRNLSENYKLFESNGKIFEQLEKTNRESEELINEIEKQVKSNCKLLDLNNNLICIFNISDLLRTGEARSERIQTSPNGYVMEICLEILRQNEGKLSITLVFLEGEYDAILHWPFTYPITLSLINMKNSSKTISQKIQGKFSSKTNNSWRNTFTIESFCSLETISDRESEYQENESIFIQFHCDFYSSTKSCK